MRSAKGSIFSASSPLPHYSLILLVSTLVFLNTLYGELDVFDDGPAIVRNTDVLGTSSIKELLRNDFWGNDILRPGSHKSYRPLTTLTFRWTYSFFGLSPFVFHLGNILLHGAVSCLVFWLAGRLKLKKYTRLTSALIFAVHPIHCESVGCLVGRADILATFFVLFGLVLWDKFESILATFLLTSCALFSKEIGLVLPLLVILFDLSRHQGLPRMQNRHILLGILFAFHAFVRITVTGSPSFSPADNPLPYEKNLLTRLATTLYLPIFHLQLLVFPKDLCFDWSMGAIPLISSANDIRLWISLGLYFFSLILLVAFHERMEIVTLFSIIFGVISFLPASNFVIYVGFLAAERILYLPSIGYCILLAVMIKKMSKRFNVSFLHLVLVILAALTARTIRRNEDWRTSESLYKSALHLNPAKAYSNLGQVLASKGDSRGAAAAYEKALNHRNMADTWYNLGVLQSGLGNHTQAVSSYSRAIRIRQSFAAAHLNLGISLRKQRRFQEAEEIFTRCLELDGKQTKNWKNHREAQTSCLLNRGLLRKQLKKYTKARTDFIVLADDILSEFYPLVITSLADIDINQGNSSVALNRIQQLIELFPNYIPAIILHSKVLSRMGNTLQAEKVLSNALNRIPKCSECMNELALLLAERNPEQAESFLREASDLAGNEIHLLNYAVILQKRRKFKEAKRIYERILNFYPGHSLALENLRKLQREMSK